MPEQQAFLPPTHPLDLLAAALDALLATPADGKRWTPSLSNLAADRLQRPEQAFSLASGEAIEMGEDAETACSAGLAARDKAWRATLSRLAAHLAVRNQVMLLGPQRVDEEPQTAALFGLLANALSMVTLLAPDDAGSSQGPPAAGCYWAHQKKRSDEPRTGGDFGIVTDLDGGMVKLTLFQAKRPQQGQRFEDLRLDHTVHDGMPETPPENEASAYSQKRALDVIKRALARGCPRDQIFEWLGEKDRWHIACHQGKSSLFVPAYSYQQSTAFLAAELHGWRQNQDAGFGGWCYYVQWPYGDARSPWAISVLKALGPAGGTNASADSLPFVDILAQALSPEETDIGMVIPLGDLGYWAGTISALMPGMLWGGSAGSAEGAVGLVRAVAPTPREIRQIDLPRSATPKAGPGAAPAPVI